jgi:ATP-dependent DNA helicase RecG
METDNKEFKEKWTDDSLKTICAFANTSGGKLIIDIYEGKFYVRSGSTTQELKDTELAYFLLKKMGKTWDSISFESNLSEIDLSTIEIFKNLAKNRIPSIEQFDSIEKIFLNLKLFDENKEITNAGILLFGKDPQKKFISATVRVGRFKNSTHIIDTVIIQGNLFKQVDDVMNAIRKHLNVRFEIKGIAREDNT